MLTDALRVKIEEVAALDGTVEEMAYYCDVSRQTIYNWFAADPEFFDRVERLRLRPILKARETINKKMSESYSNAIDYLKRKKRLEFGDNIDVTTLGKELPQPIYGGISRHNSDKKDIPTS